MIHLIHFPNRSRSPDEEREIGNNFLLKRNNKNEKKAFKSKMKDLKRIKNI